MQPIQRAFEPVSICFASDDNYAPYLKVAIYSLLCNRNRGEAMILLFYIREFQESIRERY